MPKTGAGYVGRNTFPKRTNFDNISQEDVQNVERGINARPRKCLDYKTPAEVLSSLGAITG